MACDIFRGRLVRFAWDSGRADRKPGEQRVASAVRPSMSTPFFSEPVRLEYRNDHGRRVVSHFVDGGVLSNFPVAVFDRTDGRPPRWPTFTMKLSGKPEAAMAAQFSVEGPIDFC